MGWIIISGIMVLVFGLVLLFPLGMVKMLDTFLNKPVVYLDQKLRPFRLLLGLVLLVIGGWLNWVAIGYSVLWWLHPIGLLSIFFGLFYLFLPGPLDWFSKIMNQTLFSPDEAVISIRKSLGIIFIIISLYIFYSAYLMARS